MIKMLLTFMFLSVAIGFSIFIFRRMNNLERWDLTKTVFFSIMSSMAAIVVMGVLVVLF